MPVITRAELRTLVIARAVEAGTHANGPAFFESIEAEVDQLVLLGEGSANLDRLWQELVTLRQHNVAKGSVPYPGWHPAKPLIPECAVDADGRGVGVDPLAEVFGTDPREVDSTGRGVGVVASPSNISPDQIQNKGRLSA